MLHGEPGIGKTATAQAVAQAFRRPLFPISCGQLSNPRQAEQQLSSIFHFADKWDCILLLDEVDVFLSAGTPTDDLGRNSLVSSKGIFLRDLEYYNGILFLTTNRIGKIDQAISSRIHLMLHCSRLGKCEIRISSKSTLTAYKKPRNNRAKLAASSPLSWSKVTFCSSPPITAIRTLREKGAWNGRQVRNAFIVAASLARADAQHQPPEFQPRLGYSHFKQVKKLMAEYVDFRNHVLGKTDSQLALMNEERDGDYENAYFRADEEIERSQRAQFDCIGQGGHGAIPGPSMIPPAMTRSRMAFIPQQGSQYASQLSGMQMGVGAGANGMGMGMGYAMSAYEQQGQTRMASPPQSQPSGPPCMNMGHNLRTLYTFADCFGNGQQ
ncbi:Fc.00g094250.m01.CDS01 [Cosmosporella sp. VM-42]